MSINNIHSDEANNGNKLVIAITMKTIFLFLNMKY